MPFWTVTIGIAVAMGIVVVHGMPLTDLQNNARLGAKRNKQ